MRFLILITLLVTISSATLLLHPRRDGVIGHDYAFERNCFFSPAQCLLGNFPRRSKLQPVLRLFEDSSLDSIYTKLMTSNSRSSFFGSKK
ncbi:Protein CBG22711 [Caenorhabditis briggsae]|uniref:Protein CBG22711 n=2 Tax=Caenorhabditis briggsae TaxID=6238 RepID=A8Y302_CAEBR|nr:Protein CBG22711 [Caenorhabditis briggsae]ULT84116.1 hypothetical protein L3Y34_013031 [Caenorhabditis briggsae]CAP39241.1 Protein CBG22711 [Caenorhabditis briggsae]